MKSEHSNQNLNPRSTRLLVVSALNALVAFLWLSGGGGFMVTVTILLWLINWAFTWVRWYPSLEGRVGIEDHFDLVAAVSHWLLLGAFVLHAVLLPFRLVFIPALIFGVVGILFNVYLMNIHGRDKDEMPPNVLSSGSRVF